MSEYRRSALKGGTYFFTVALEDRTGVLLVEHIELLRESVRSARKARPFHIDAWVVLPDHMHCVWTLPEGDSDFSTRWRDIKRRFAKGLPRSELISDSKLKRGERGIWQRRFWEHTIINETDYEAHVNYIHLNPVKHGLVESAVDWPYSTFHRYVKAGVYPVDWMSRGLI